MQALADCIERDELAPIAQAMIDTPEDWPARIVVAALDTLYPSVVDEAGLSRLVERAQMSGDLVSLRIRLREIAQTINPVSVPAERLLQEMVALLARETDASRDLVRRSAFPDVAEMVATLCLRRLAADGSPAPAPVIEAYLLLAELDRYNHYSDEHAKSLAKRLRGNPLDRRALLLGGLDRAKAVAKESHALAFRADAYSIPIIAENTPWFLDQVASE